MYKNMKNRRSRGSKDASSGMPPLPPTSKVENKVETNVITNESIMEIIQKSQRGEKKVSTDASKYVSLVETKEPEVIEKNIIVDDADLELAD